jgi:muramoyltetrapeptide carboxypeptidase
VINVNAALSFYFQKSMPPFLKPYDRVGVLAMASRLDYSSLTDGLNLMREDWQLDVVEGKTLKASYNQFAGTDEQRLQDLQTMLDDDSLSAIFSARGGYGSSRLIDRLDFKKFRKRPKWIVGFSDITALHCHLHRLGIESIHGIMPKNFVLPQFADATESLRKILFGEPQQYTVPPHPFNRFGMAEGQLVGGNLCILAHLIGSRSDLKTNNKILFLEDIGEYYYNLDRMMVQLKRAKKLDNLAGLIIGNFIDLKDNRDVPFGKTVYEIIAEHSAEYNYPVCYDFPVGHGDKNVAMPVSRNVQLSVSETSSYLAI